MVEINICSQSVIQLNLGDFKRGASSAARKRIYIPLPENEGRQQLFQINLREANDSSSETLSKLQENKL